MKFEKSKRKRKERIQWEELMKNNSTYIQDVLKTLRKKNTHTQKKPNLVTSEKWLNFNIRENLKSV